MLIFCKNRSIGQYEILFDIVCFLLRKSFVIRMRLSSRSSNRQPSFGYTNDNVRQLDVCGGNLAQKLIDATTFSFAQMWF